MQTRQTFVCVQVLKQCKGTGCVEPTVLQGGLVIRPGKWPLIHLYIQFSQGIIEAKCTSEFNRTSLLEMDVLGEMVKIYKSTSENCGHLEDQSSQASVCAQIVSNPSHRSTFGRKHHLWCHLKIKFRSGK